MKLEAANPIPIRKNGGLDAEALPSSPTGAAETSASAGRLAAPVSTAPGSGLRLRLRRVELQGFKTFANRTSFEFNCPLTAVVGPNGSGKSNLADAIRWVLGEQSLKAVRGRRTEDVIFAGGSGRSPAGFAEVSITINNADGLLDLPYSEVSITRRAYRSGENEYFVNRARVRLRDLTDLLQKARLSQNAYSVIGQGMVDAILNQRPEERRELLEEAAGVKRYYTRIAESQAQLADTERNLLRAQDIMSELEPRLVLLTQQADRALEHATITRELQAALRQLYSHRLQQFLDARRRAAEQLERADGAVRLEQRRLDELRRQAEDLEAQIARGRAQLELWRQELAKHREQTTYWMQQAELASEIHRAYHRQRLDLQTEIAELQRDRSVLKQSCQLAAADRNRIEEEKARTAAHLAQNEAKLADHRRQHSSTLTALEKYKQELARQEAHCLSLRRDVERKQDAEGHLLMQRTAQKRDIEARSQRLGALDRIVREREADVPRCRELEQQARERVSSLAAEAERAEQREREAASQLDRIDRERHRLKARLDVLRNSQEAYTGYYSGVKAVLTASNGHQSSGLRGIVGPVSSLLHVPAHLETAIEVALGSHIQDVVVERWEDAEEAIAWLKSTQSGRATFLPLDTIRGSVGGNAPQGEGVMGIAASLVDCEPGYDKVAAHLLGRTIVVTELEVARRVLPQCSPIWQIVTPGGEIVRANGAVTGGAGNGPTGFLSRARELRDLPRQLASLDTQAEQARRALDEAKAERGRLGRELSQAQREMLDAEGARRRAGDALASARRDLGQRRAELASSESAQTRLEAEARKLAAARAQTQTLLRRAEEELGAAARFLREEETALAQLVQREAAIEADLARQRTETAILEQRRQAQDEHLSSLGRTLADLESRLSAKLARAAELTEAESEKARQADDATSKAKELTRQRAQLEGRMDSAQTDLHHVEVSLKTCLKELESQMSRFSQAETQRREAAVELQRALGIGESLRLEMERDLGSVESETPEGWRLLVNDQATVLAPATVADIEELQASIDRLRARLRALGPINHQAIAEQAQLKERHEFLAAQIKDLHQAADSMRQVTAELQRTARQRLHESFNAVAVEFRRCFTTLFQGGSARLVLTDPNDLSQTGLEIIAQPPGKRSQPLAVLSGGERALTGVALLFAILLTHPIPFCFLDEVDAALDEANVGRFCQMLQRLTSRTQFVLVTHNRTTMEAAGALYGVSLSDNSASRIVSLRLCGETDARNGSSHVGALSSTDL